MTSFPADELNPTASPQALRALIESRRSVRRFLPEAVPDAVIRDYAWGGQNLLDVLTAPYTKVSASLATFYGLGAPGAQGRVDIAADHVRAGLLGHQCSLHRREQPREFDGFGNHAVHAGGLVGRHLMHHGVGGDR